MGEGKVSTGLVRRVAHDLRTPLNTLLGFAQLMQRDRDTPLEGQQREWLEYVIESGRRLHAVAEQLTAPLDAETIPPELQAIIRAAPDLYLVLTPDLRIIEASDAYLLATMTTRDAIVGQDVFVAFPDDPSNQGGESEARRALSRVVTERRPNGRVVRYPIKRRDGRGFEERFWRTSNTPVFGSKQEVLFVLHRVEDITESVALERERAELSAETRRYVRLLDGAPDAIVITAEDGTIRLVNRRAEELFGYPRGQLVAMPLATLIPEYVVRFRGRQVAQAVRMSGRRQDGRAVPIEVSLSPIEEDKGVVVAVTIRDISDRDRLESSLASAVESVGHAFALFDAEDRLLACNRMFRMFVGIQADGVGTSFAEVLDRCLPGIAFSSDEERAAFRARRLSRRRTEDSISIDVIARGRHLRVTDRRTAEGGLVTTIVDRTEDEILVNQLGQARAAAEAARLASGELLAAIGHELRAPMHALLGLARRVEPDRGNQLGEHVLRAIDDIVELSRIESGQVALSSQSVEVAELLGQVRRTLEPLASRARIALTVEPPPPGAPMVRADPALLAQILVSFGAIAIEHDRPGGVVTMSVRGGDGVVRVSVRAGAARDLPAGRTIGFAITKRLAASMTGTVGATTEPGAGAELWVELPVARAQKATTKPIVATYDGPELTILYIEDNAANVAFMSDFLDGAGNYRLLTAATAQAGIALVEQQQPDIILMDMNLPEMSGREALALLRANRETAHIPVVAVTAAASEGDRGRGLAAGFFRYLTKPVDLDELAATLVEVNSRAQ